MSRRPADLPVSDPEPGESPPRRNPRTHLLNKARDEAGVYDAEADEPGQEAVRPRRFATAVTGRTARLVVKLKEETRERLRQIAGREGISQGELIEQALDAYEKGGGRT